MSRLDTMARFAEPEDEVVGGYCDCCNEELYQGQTVVKFDGELFCNRDCFMSYMDVKEGEL